MSVCPSRIQNDLFLPAQGEGMGVRRGETLNAIKIYILLELHQDVVMLFHHFSDAKSRAIVLFAELLIAKVD